MKVLLVAGGDLPIPPPAWGGIENLIWQQSVALREAGHTVHILNKKRKRTFSALKAMPWRYDVVHLHLDAFSEVWVPLARRFRFPLVISTHYGYAAFPERWSDYYRRIVGHMAQADYMLVLSREMRQTLLNQGFRGTIYVLPNGIDCDNVRCAPHASKQAIVLGRVEARKQQALMTTALNEHTVQVDFVGPMGEDAEGFAPNGRNTCYIGQWSREQVHQDLTRYACLVLLSDGEGHAGVVSEAMAAGLSLVLSPEASHNLDLSREWIHIVDRDKDNIGDVIARAVQENRQYRGDIRRYCVENFDWKLILPQYVGILEQVASGKNASLTYDPCP